MAKIYSHSKISTFEQCPLKFRFRYIDKITPEIEKTIEAYLGQITHDTLEWVYTEKEKNNLPNLDKVIEYFAQKWEDTFTEKIEIIKEGKTPKDYFNKGVEFLISYYLKNQPFDDGTIECEKKIMLDLDAEGKYKIIGYIDRVAKNPKTGDYEIHDYKTANNLPVKEKVETDRQLALYSIAIKELFEIENIEKISLIWHYLAHNQKIESKRTEKEIEKLKEETIEKIKEIESAEEFNPNPSILCAWCEFKNTCKELEKANSFKKVHKDISESYFNQKSSFKQENNIKKDELDIW